MARHTVRIEATADTYTDVANPNNNYGSAISLQTKQRYTDLGYGRYLISPDKIIYINFPTPNIPAIKNIISAKLFVYCNHVDLLEPGSNPQLSFQFGQPSAAWQESNLTWNNQPSLDKKKKVYVDTGSGYWSEFDALEYVTDAINGTNRGVAIHLDDEIVRQGLYEVRFDSRETSNRPYLEIIYEDTPPLPPSGLAPNGTSIQRGQNVTFSWTYNPIHANDYQTKFDLEWSDDAGQTWNRITETSQTPEYTMSTTAFSVGQVLWRVRTYDRYDQVSDWSTQATIQILGALAPTGLVPNGVHVNVEEAIVFSWVFNSDVPGDVQTKFDLQWSANGGITWNTITQETQETSYVMPPNTLPLGNTVWRVRCYDSLNNQSAWSEQAFVSTFGAPSIPTITMPNVVGQANPIVTWTTEDEQFGYELQVWDGTELYWTSGQVFTGLKSAKIEKNLQNNTTYTIRLRIMNQHNLWSDWAERTIITDYAEPAEPIVTLEPQNGYLEVIIKNTPGEVFDRGFITEPATEFIDFGFITDEPTEYLDYGFIDDASVEYNEIYRRELGGEWVKIATNVPTDGHYQDYGVASGVEYEYMAVAFGIGGGVAESEIERGMIILKGTWIHIADNPQETVHVFMYSTRGDRSDNWQPNVEFMQFAGRTNPVAEYGDAENYSVRFSLRIKDNADFEQLKKLIKSKKTLCYRDPRGRRVFGIIQTLPFHDRFFGYDIALEIVQTDYKEGI